jgi:hypothetical protein
MSNISKYWPMSTFQIIQYLGVVEENKNEYGSDNPGSLLGHEEGMWWFFQWI